jgi:hypothetical protein
LLYLSFVRLFFNQYYCISDLQAGEKGQTRGVEVRSELYEVLALLERASVSKEMEGEVVNKLRKRDVVNEETEVEIVENSKEKVLSKMQQSITKTTNILEPPRTTSRVAVLAHESSVLSDGRDDSILTADTEAELTPSYPPPPPLEETVLEIGDEG